ncbi:MAG: hypothetical protein KIT84_35900 [Labilithrix sp.]|nr:hypothetical protein [Labilithrix sp.]MCW5816438.1 hypothetical protein [Labilithrix sp.]
MKIRSLAFALTLLSAACGTEVITRTEQPTPDTNSTEPTKTVAGGVSIDRVSIYQGVEVRLVEDGALTEERNAPILTKRPALVRVHAKRLAGARPPKVSAKLHVKSGGEETVLSAGPRSLGVYVDSDLDTTFNFELDAELVTKDLELSVDVIGATKDDAIHFPEGDETIAAEAVDAPPLRVQLVPVKYTAEGEERLPDLSDANVKRYHDALYKLYPVSEVEVSLHAELAFPIPIAPDGDGWSELLNTVMNMRAEEEVDDDVYYIGVFTPAPTLREFCMSGGGGCILGIAPASGYNAELDTNMSLRSALVLGYQTEKSGGTLAQELAHAMGRLHAPCGNPNAIDKKYPYEDARVGTSGWDPLTKELKSGEDHADFMSYCSPVWVSDYTWKAIHQRMNKVTDVMAAKDGTTKSIEVKKPSSIPKLSPEQIAWTRDAL